MVISGRYMSNNSAALFLAGVLIGAGININLIGSLSYLLSITDPIYVIYMTATGLTTFVVFLYFFRFIKISFANFVVFTAIFFTLLLYSLTLKMWGEVPRAIAWYGLSIFAGTFFKWCIFQLSIRHLNPARAQHQFYYNSRAYELGNLLVVVLLVSTYTGQPPEAIIHTSMVILLLFALLLSASLCHKKNIEIHYSKKKRPSESLMKVPVFKTMTLFFLSMALFMGAFETLTSHAVNLYFEEHLVTYDRIIRVMSLVFLFSSITLILISIVVSKVIKCVRLSPVRVLAIHTLIIAAMTGYTLLYPSLFSFVMLQVLLLSSQGIFHVPAVQMIIASFPVQERARLGRIHYKYCYSIPNIILATVLTFSVDMEYENLLQLVLVMILGTTAITGILLVYFRSALIRVFYYAIRLESKRVAILAAQALSYLHPKNYSDKMIEVLQTKPKKLLRKMIIVGLGYHGDHHVFHRLCQEFESDKEEIQLSVLDALSKCKDFQGTDFIVEVLLGKHLTRSVNVRISAAKILAGMYGKSAIPMLLHGLHDEDKRVQANVLEVLGVFKDKRLLSVIKPFIKSDNSRIRANALMALSNFYSQRDAYRHGILQMLSSNNENFIASALYVVGKNQDHFFLSNLLTILDSSFHKSSMIKRDLALALTNLNHPKGFELFEELFSATYKAGPQEDFIHLYTQLDYELRFDVLEYMLRRHLGDIAFRNNVLDHLKKSSFDFHDEIDYLFS